MSYYTGRYTTPTAEAKGINQIIIIISMFISLLKTSRVFPMLWFGFNNTDVMRMTTVFISFERIFPKCVTIVRCVHKQRLNMKWDQCLNLHFLHSRMNIWLLWSCWIQTHLRKKQTLLSYCQMNGESINKQHVVRSQSSTVNNRGKDAAFCF